MLYQLENPKVDNSSGNNSTNVTTHPNRRILIIDDEPFNLKALEVTIKCLKISGLSSIIDTAMSGSIALNKIEEGLQLECQSQ